MFLPLSDPLRFRNKEVFQSSPRYSPPESRQAKGAGPQARRWGEIERRHFPKTRKKPEPPTASAVARRLGFCLPVLPACCRQADAGRRLPLKGGVIGLDRQEDSGWAAGPIIERSPVS